MKNLGFEYHHNENPWEHAPPWALELLAHMEKIMSAIDDLATAVAAEDTVIDSAIALLQGLSAALAAAGTDPAKLAALQTDITTKTQALAAAVAANTPAAAPAPTPAAPTP
jgi:peptidoglycan hydrolase CwlO-like protein